MPDVLEKLGTVTGFYGAGGAANMATVKEAQDEIARLRALLKGDGLSVLQKAVNELKTIAMLEAPQPAPEDREKNEYFNMGVRCAVDTLEIYLARARAGEA